MKAKAKAKPKQRAKKEFVKQTRKVGARKFASNETHANSVQSKRVIMPVQRLGSDDVIVESLTGLRHYNEKKRLDAINTFIRGGFSGIPEDRLGEVLAALGYCLSDDDEVVRGKCSSFLFSLLNEVDETIMDPFYPKLCIHVRAGLANVNPSVRFDSIQFLHRIVNFPIFDGANVHELIKSLVELNSTLVTNQVLKSSGKKGVQIEVRTTLWQCVESLLEQLLEKKNEVEAGYINPSQWTVTAVLNRAFAPPSGVGFDIKKLLVSLDRQGEDAVKDRIEELATSCELIARKQPVAFIPLSESKQAKQKKRLNSGSSAFSKLSMLTRGDSD